MGWWNIVAQDGLVSAKENSKQMNMGIQKGEKWILLLMEETLRQLIGSLDHYLKRFYKFYTSQLVQDFFHEQ